MPRLRPLRGAAGGDARRGADGGGDASAQPRPPYRRPGGDGALRAGRQPHDAQGAPPRREGDVLVVAASERPAANGERSPRSTPRRKASPASSSTAASATPTTSSPGAMPSGAPRSPPPIRRSAVPAPSMSRWSAPASASAPATSSAPTPTVSSSSRRALEAAVAGAEARAAEEAKAAAAIEEGKTLFELHDLGAAFAASGSEEKDFLPG